MAARCAPLALALLASCAPVAAQEAGPELRPFSPGTPPQGAGATDARPGFAILPADDDGSFTDGTPREGFDRLKRIPLGEAVRLSFSGPAYVEWEAFEDAAFGLEPGWNAYSNDRLNLYAELAFGQRLRLFGALKHGRRGGSDFPVPPTERDDADLHQGFVEVAFGDALGLPTGDAFMRVGRQELHYGSGRVISVREGPNVRDDFDGAVLRLRVGGRVTDVFAVAEVFDETGAFDDQTLEDRGAWGLYSSAPLPGRIAGKAHALDLYYFGNRRVESPYAQAIVDEMRHTLGVRWASAGGTSGPGWLWDADANAQLGSASGGRDVSGWSLSAQLGHGWKGPLAPALVLSTGANSGDDDPRDDRLTTDRAPYPPGRSFGDTTPFGPGNLAGASLALALALSPTDRLTVTPGVIGFWRMAAEDGVYSPAGTPVRPAGGDDHSIGWEASLAVAWAIDCHWSLSGEIAHFFANGGYLGDNPPAEDISRAKLQLALRF